MTKDKKFQSSNTINAKGILLDLSTTQVMGILNITFDSFYDGGKNNTLTKAVEKAHQFIKEGAKIIDIGAYSSRPGAKHISATEEWNRLKTIIPIINKEFPETVLSVDTFRSEIARKSIDSGAHMINDISAGEMDEKMFDTISELKVPYILMHMKGKPQNMQNNPQYECIEDEIVDFFKKKISILEKKGVEDIIVDPGFGFGKTLAHNYRLLNKMEKLNELSRPLLAGVSRKSMIYKLLETQPQEALNGTSVLHTICLLKGVSFLRVHDVKEAVECVKIINFAKNNS